MKRMSKVWCTLVCLLNLSTPTHTEINDVFGKLPTDLTVFSHLKTARNSTVDQRNLTGVDVEDFVISNITGKGTIPQTGSGYCQSIALLILTATTEQRLEILCTCNNICISRDTVTIPSLSNRTVLGAFEDGTNYIFYLTFVIYVCIIALGTIANSLVIIGILGLMKDKTVVNRFVASLALADLILSAFITPVKLLYLVDVMNNVTVTWLCKLILYFRQMCQSEAIFILTIVSYERYYAICHPLKAKFRCSMKRCHVLIVISWMAAMVVGIPTLISAEYPDELGPFALCSIQYEQSYWMKVHYFYFLTILTIIPTAIMSYTYGRICYVLWKSSKKAAEMTSKDTKDKKASSEITARVKVIKTMVALFVVFVICWSPRMILNVVSVFYVFAVPATGYYMDLLTEILANGHSLINPIVFIMFSQPLRLAFAKRLADLCGTSKRSPDLKLSMTSGKTVSVTVDPSTAAT